MKSQQREAILQKVVGMVEGERQVIGAFSCLGSHVGRLESWLTFETLLPRIKPIELAGAVAGCATPS